MNQVVDYSRLLYEVVTTFMALMALWQWVRRKMAREDKLDRLLQQFLPNGGSSIVDRVGKVERSVGSLEHSYADLKTVNDGQLQRLTRIEQAVNELTNHSEK